METESRPTNQPTYGSDQPDYLKYLAELTGEGLSLLKSVCKERRKLHFLQSTTIMQDYLTPEATPIAICVESAIMTSSVEESLATKENYNSYDLFE